jgi:hypothetical protein
MAKKGFEASGRMSVEKFEKLFRAEFDVYCDIINEKGKIAKQKASLANLRPKDFKAPGKVDFSLSANMLAVNVQKKFRENFGLELQIYKLTKPADKDTLSSLRKGVLLGVDEWMDDIAYGFDESSESSEDTLLNQFKNELMENNELNEILKNGFEFIDTDANGFIDLKEYLHFSKIFCKNSDSNYDEEDETYDFNELDKNSDSKIDFNEFKDGMISKFISETSESDIEGVPLSLLCKPIIDVMEQIFSVARS